MSFIQYFENIIYYIKSKNWIQIIWIHISWKIFTHYYIWIIKAWLFIYLW